MKYFESSNFCSTFRICILISIFSLFLTTQITSTTTLVKVSGHALTPLPCTGPLPGLYYLALIPNSLTKLVFAVFPPVSPTLKPNAAPPTPGVGQFKGTAQIIVPGVCLIGPITFPLPEAYQFVEYTSN